MNTLRKEVILHIYKLITKCHQELCRLITDRTPTTSIRNQYSLGASNTTNSPEKKPCELK